MGELSSPAQRTSIACDSKQYIAQHATIAGTRFQYLLPGLQIQLPHAARDHRQIAQIHHPPEFQMANPRPRCHRWHQGAVNAVMHAQDVSLHAGRVTRAKGAPYTMRTEGRLCIPRAKRRLCILARKGANGADTSGGCRVMSGRLASPYGQARWTIRPFIGKVRRVNMFL